MTSDPTAAADARKSSGGWQRVATENFNTLDPQRWSKFQGRPGCCAETVWDPSRVSVSGGVLTLANHPDADGTWRSGGVGAWDWSAATRRFGRWDARIRFDSGTGISGTALLWPAGEGWPPEINYFEIFETWGSRNRLMTTTHYGTPSNHQVDQRITRAKFTNWHVFSVRWTPRSLTFVVDGRVVHKVRDRAAIPRQRMWPGFQTHVHKLGNGKMPSLPGASKSVRMQVDWMRVFKRR
ncbi:glycoside hydrolase family 16 protein [Nocardioides pacificus]